MFSESTVANHCQAQLLALTERWEARACLSDMWESPELAQWPTTARWSYWHLSAEREKLAWQICGSLHSWHCGAWPTIATGAAIGTDWALRGKSLLVGCVGIFTAGTVANHIQVKLLALTERWEARACLSVVWQSPQLAQWISTARRSYWHWLSAERQEFACRMCGNLHSWHSGQPQPDAAIGTDWALRGKSLLVGYVGISRVVATSCSPAWSGHTRPNFHPAQPAVSHTLEI